MDAQFGGVDQRKIFTFAEKVPLLTICRLITLHTREFMKGILTKYGSHQLLNDFLHSTSLTWATRREYI